MFSLNQIHLMKYTQLKQKISTLSDYWKTHVHLSLIISHISTTSHPFHCEQYGHGCSYVHLRHHIQYSQHDFTYHIKNVHKLWLIYNLNDWYIPQYCCILLTNLMVDQTYHNVYRILLCTLHHLSLLPLSPTFSVYI